MKDNIFEDNYLNLVSDVLTTGMYNRYTRNQATKSLFAQTLVIEDLANHRFPLLTSRKMYPKGILGELAAFIREPKHVKDFEKYGCNYWKQWADKDGNLNLDYGKGWKEQFSTIIDTVNSGRHSRRLLVDTWDYKNLEDLSLPCCHYSYQFYVRGMYLDLLWNQRSADVMVGVPSDIVLASAMLIALSAEVGLWPGNITMMFGDTHIYESHFDKAFELLGRETLALPTFEYCYDNKFFEFEPDNLKIIDYEHLDPIKFELVS